MSSDGSRPPFVARQTVLVLSAIHRRLEDRLVSQGIEVVIVVPFGTQIGHGLRQGALEILELGDWFDFSTLRDIAYLAASHGVTTIETVDERCVVAAAFIRGILGLEGMSFPAAVSFTDKNVMKSLLRSSGIPVAPFKLVRREAEVIEFGDDVGWPIIVKPRFGFSSINTFILSNRDDVSELNSASTAAVADLEAYPELAASPVSSAHGSGTSGFVVERKIDVVREFHCEVLVVDGVVQYCLPFRYPVPLLEASKSQVGSVSLPRSGSEVTHVVQLALRSIKVLGLRTGFAHCEVLLGADGRFVLGEVAARPGGSRVPEALRLQYGIDVYEIASLLALHQPVALSLSERKDSLAWVSVGVAESGSVITAVPSARDLVGCAGFVQLEVAYAPGDQFAGQAGSLAYLGYVFARGKTYDDALANARAAATVAQSRFQFVRSA